MRSSGLMVFLLWVYPYQRKTYFKDGPYPMCRSMRSIVLPPSSALGLLERLYLFEWDFGISKAELVCGRLCVRRWCEEVVDVRIT